MRKVKTIARLLLGIAAGGLSLAGCTKDAAPTPEQSPAAAARESVKTHGGRMLRAGEAPFNYLIGGGGSLTIIDATLDHPLVTKLKINPQTLVTIDQITGINVGSQKVLSGPLPLYHRFELWLEQ